jgi:hypothetical protein
MDVGTTVVGGAAGIGIITALWNKIKIYASKIYSLLVVRISCQGWDLNRGVALLLTKEFKCSRWGVKQYCGASEFIKPLRQYQEVALELIPAESTLWWRNYKPIMVSRTGDGVINIGFLRGIYNADKLILEAISHLNKFNGEIDSTRQHWKQGSNRFFIRREYGNIGGNGRSQMNAAEGVPEEPPQYATASKGNKVIATDSLTDKHTSRILQWTLEDIGQPQQPNALDKLSLAKNILDAIEEALLWRSSEKWFKEKGVPWRRGFLLEGPTGTGKTAFTRALAQDLNMPIISFDLGTMTSKDFANTWSRARSHSPCIVLLEDIDAVFNGRENIAAKGMNQGLSFDCLLNTIDGVENTEGVFLIITTNNVQSLDPALGNPYQNGSGMSTRPGRIDRAIHFGALDESGRQKMAQRILGDFPEEKWKYLYEEGKSDSGAQFQERCCRLALKLFWHKE